MTAPAPNITSAALNRSLATAASAFERRALEHVRRDGLAGLPPRHAERAIEVAGKLKPLADVGSRVVTAAVAASRAQPSDSAD
jgi:hypothetical protein